MESGLAIDLPEAAFRIRPSTFDSYAAALRLVTCAWTFRSRGAFAPNTRSPSTRWGVRSVADYRLYFMERFSGHIAKVHEFEADNDLTAVGIAEGWRANGPMELWSRDRKVKRWDALPIVPRQQD